MDERTPLVSLMREEGEIGFPRHLSFLSQEGYTSSRPTDNSRSRNSSSGTDCKCVTSDTRYIVRLVKSM